MYSILLIIWYIVNYDYIYRCYVMKHKILRQKLHDDTLQCNYYRLTESSNEPALTRIKKQMFTLMSISRYITLNKKLPPKIFQQFINIENCQDPVSSSATVTTMSNSHNTGIKTWWCSCDLNTFQTVALWDVTQCSPVCRYLYLEKHAASTFQSTLKMEATGSSRSFVHSYISTWQHSIISWKTVILNSLPTHI